MSVRAYKFAGVYVCWLSGGGCVYGYSPAEAKKMYEYYSGAK